MLLTNMLYYLNGKVLHHALHGIELINPFFLLCATICEADTIMYFAIYLVSIFRCSARINSRL